MKTANFPCCTYVSKTETTHAGINEKLKLKKHIVRLAIAK